MAGVRRSERFEGLPPFPAARQGVDDLGAAVGVGVVPVEDPPWPDRVAHSIAAGVLTVFQNGAGTIVAVGSSGWTGPMIPSAISAASLAPRGPKALSHNGTFMGRGPASPSAWSMLTGLPLTIAVSPASSWRSART